MRLHELVFGIPLTIGVMLVLCSALGGTDLDGDAEPTGESSDSVGALALLGFGRVPLVVFAMFLSLLSGGIGFAVAGPMTSLWGERMGLLVALPCATLGALLGTAVGTRLLAKVFPRTETYAPTARELVGFSGTVLVKLSDRDAVVRVIDAGGAELRLRCLLNTPFTVGDVVSLVAHDSEHDVYVAQGMV